MINNCRDALWFQFAKIDLKRIFELLFDPWSSYHAQFVMGRTFWRWEGMELVLGAINAIIHV